MTEPLRLHLDAAVGRIVFDRPQALNAIDQATARAFEAAVVQALDAGVRVLTLSGNGRAFMAGGDLAAFRRVEDRAAEAEAIIAPMNRALARLAESDALTVALLHGPVAGAGLSLALAADLALAAESAVLSFAYLKIGAPADCGISWNLPRIVGLRRAAWIAFEGSTVPAGQALDWGLVNRVVPDVALQDEGAGLAARLAGLAPGAAAALKHLLRDSFGRDYATTLKAEKQAFKTCAASADFAEALSAFFDKRPARFTGK
ncbi:enoyl-CoA hydratase/isomerase family protein [Paracoccus siganidrum]|uniref:Enoyl-CoA hydratase/isomerase family protein n=1 Tax=Paracoccus siganidrum TaxID=1276757 RepID=A0A419AAS4_9RHOB|nr:enoyl-CoA hydratase/isomerase family protein [Paracoccus siganidrum]RJL20212.1 enoyl-CoA hydratase/isomerase family protein [Paracoccus siganidrum]RMC30778.1 enoyl-CoA hydratase [Paracoccus siganidrum]